MENHVLSAVRMHGASADAPEFADNPLAVEIRFSESLKHTRDLSVRIYDTTHHLMGVGASATGRARSLKRFSVCVQSAENWDAGSYTALVYRNGTPMWIAHITLGYDVEACCRARLEPLEEYPVERFFAQEVCLTDWWAKLDSGFFPVMQLGMTIEKLFRMSAVQYAANVLVAGDRAGVFSSVALAGYLSGGNRDACFSFSLDELFTGVFTVDSLRGHFAGKRSVVVKLSDREYGTREKSLLGKFLALVARNSFPLTSFVFCGTVEDVKRFDTESAHAGMYFVRCMWFPLDEEAENAADTMQSLILDFDTDMLSAPLPVAPEPEEDAVCCCNVPTECVSSSLQAIDGLVGMQRLKNEIADARIMALFRRERMKMRLDTASDNRNHMLFLGNPGTGKTTVAKLIGVMYHEMGILSSGHTVTVDRTRLVGQYIGHTESNMKDVIEKARGGVLFIDEAYTLFTGSDDQKDYGWSVMAALLPLLAEPEPDMIVIMAGYEDKMQKLLDSNPGLRDRFPLRFHFDDYSADELLEIARRACSGMNYELTMAAETRLKEIIDDAVRRHDMHFGNGRWVNNLIEHGILKSMARRVMSLGRSGDRRLFSMIEECDVAEAEQVYLRGNMPMVKPVRKIGFIA